MGSVNQDRYYRSKFKEIATFCNVVQSKSKIVEFLLYNRKKYGQGKLFPELKRIFIRKEIIPIAAHLGYYFTVDEFLMYEEKIMELYSKKSLSEDELKEISSGTCLPIVKNPYVLNDIFKDVNLGGYSMSPTVEARNDMFYYENDDLSCTRIKNGDIVYDIDLTSMTAKVTRCSSKLSGKVVVPKVLQGKYLVVGVKEGAFCDKNIVSIELPTSVKSIGDYAFERCVNLKYVSGCINVSCIGESAFEGCKNLEMIDSLGNITNIQKNTFRDCRSLDYVNIGRLVSYIDDTAFCNCINIVHLNVSNSNLVYVYRKNIGVTKFDDLMHVVIKVDEADLNRKKAMADKLHKGFEVLKGNFFELHAKPSYIFFLRYVRSCMNNILSSYELNNDSVKNTLLNSPKIMYRVENNKKVKNKLPMERFDLGVCAFESMKYVKYCCGNSSKVCKVHLSSDLNIINQSELDDIKYFIEKQYKSDGYIDSYRSLFKKSRDLKYRMSTLLLNNDSLIAMLLGYNAIYYKSYVVEIDRGDGICESIDTSFMRVLDRNKIYSKKAI